MEKYVDDLAEVHLRENYITAKQQSSVIQKQFKNEAELGAMIEIGLEEARAKFDNLAVASSGAIEKKDGSY